MKTRQNRPLDDLVDAVVSTDAGYREALARIQQLIDQRANIAAQIADLKAQRTRARMSDDPTLVAEATRRILAGELVADPSTPSDLDAQVNALDLRSRALMNAIEQRRADARAVLERAVARVYPGARRAHEQAVAAAVEAAIELERALAESEDVRLRHRYTAPDGQTSDLLEPAPWPQPLMALRGSIEGFCTRCRERGYPVPAPGELPWNAKTGKR